MAGTPPLPPIPSDDELLVAALEHCKRLARAGNPFPLIAFQWPGMLITDPEEAKFFDGEIGNIDNPCLRLDDWQRNDVIGPFFDDTIAEVAIKGNTKAGKGASVSMSINLWFDIYTDAKIILSSQRYQHAIDVIFGEVVKWRGRMRMPGDGRTLAQGIADTSEHYVTIANPRSGEGFSGQHGERVLFVMDEATSMPDSTYDDACKQAKKIVALANPRVLFGWFRRMYDPCNDRNVTQTVGGPMGLRRCVTVDGALCCNVRNKRLDSPVAPIGGITINDREFKHNERIPPEYFDLVKPLIPQQVDYRRYMAICSHRDPKHVAVFAHGHFPEEDEEKQVILGSWLPRHQAAWRERLPVACFGLDVSASLDGDETILTAGGKEGIAGIEAFQHPDTMQTVKWTIETAQRKYGIDLRRGKCPIVVDMDGLGKGVGDRLKEMGCWVIEFHGNGSALTDPARYNNRRTEAYGEFGRRLNPNDRWGADDYALPHDEFLAQELCAPEKLYGRDAFRFGISPKKRKPGMEDSVETIYDKIGRSPDRADSAVMMFEGIRELGLWTSWSEVNERREVAFVVPDTEKLHQEAMASIAAPDTDRRVRELLRSLQQQAEGGASPHALERYDDW